MPSTRSSTPNVDMQKTGSKDGLIEYYYSAKLQYRTWDTYYMILDILTDGNAIKPELPVTLAEIDSRYNTLLRNLDDQLKQEDHLLNEKAKLGKLTDADKARREAIAKEKENVKAKMDSLSREQAEFREKLEREAGEQMQAYLRQLNAVKVPSKPTVDVQDPVTFILGIEDYRNIFRDTKNDLTVNLNRTFNEFEEQADLLAKKKLNAKVMTNIALVDTDGIPTESYIEMIMEKDLDPALIQLYRTYYDNAHKMYDAACDSLKEIAEGAEKNIKILNSTSFTISRFNNEINSSLKYDNESHAWKGTAWFNVAGQEVSMQFKIPYVNITGHYPSTDINEYLSELEFYHKILTSSDLAYDVEVTYHIEGKLKDNTYTIKLDRILVTNPLGDEDSKFLYTCTQNPSVDFTITYNPTDMTNIVTENKFGIKEQLPPLKPLGLMPNVEGLDLPEEPALKVAKPHKTSELPPDPVNHVQKVKLKTKSSSNIGFYLSGSFMFDTGLDRRDDIYSLGLSWRTKNPMFGNTYFRLGVGGTFAHLQTEDMKAGGNIALGFQKYINSETYFYAGADVDAAYAFQSGNGLDITPVGVLGFGGEASKVDAELDFICGCTLNQNGWKPELVFGARFKTILLFK